MRLVAYLIALLLVTPVLAQEPVFEPDITKQCQAGNPVPQSCIGASAAVCIETSDGVTAAQGYCYYQELQYWDGLLDKHFAVLGAGLRRWDAELIKSGNGASTAEEKLRDMQRTWIAYRDARCSLADFIHGGGNGNTPAHVACEMHATAEHVLLLRAMLEAP